MNLPAAKAFAHRDAEQTHYLYSSLGLSSGPVEDSSGEPVVFQSEFNHLYQTVAGS